MSIQGFGSIDIWNVKIEGFPGVIDEELVMGSELNLIAGLFLVVFFLLTGGGEFQALLGMGVFGEQVFGNEMTVFHDD